MLPILKDGIIYPLPKVVYRMFDYTDVPEVSSCTVDRYCLFFFSSKFKLFWERLYCAG